MRKRRHGQEGISLIELLVGMIVAAILTTMILGTWFALQGSFSYSMTSNFQREDARTALSRMQREIRDAEALSGNGEPALYRAHAYYVAFFTTFNKADNSAAGALPHLVAYRLYGDRTLWRFYDKDDNGAIGGDVAGISLGTVVPTVDNPTGYNPNEQQTGEGATKVLSNIVNFTRSGGPLPMFTYLYYDTAGVMQSPSLVTGTTNRTNTTAVTSRILEDLNPGHSPVYADLEVTSQLRNQR
jgi:type II secretory pathway pseudopilin PulG